MFDNSCNNVYVMPNIYNAYLILICGGTSSGKSSIVEQLMHTFKRYVAKVSQDSFYKSAHANSNFDRPDSIESTLLIDIVKKLKSGQDVDIPVYDFATHSRTDQTVRVKSKPIIIVEGILVMCYQELVELADLKVYVHAELDTRLLRRIKRDKSERGRTEESVIEQWFKTVKPMHMEYVEPCKSRADFIINNDEEQIMTEPEKIPQLQILMAFLDSYLSQLSQSGSGSMDQNQLLSCSNSDSYSDLDSEYVQDILDSGDVHF